MKIYVVIEQYYDFCNFWDTPVAYYLSEDKAYNHMLTIQEQYEKEKLSAENYTVDVREIETED